MGVAGQFSRFERVMFSVGLVFQDKSFPVQALMDSGADQSFIRTSLAQELGIPLIALNTPLVSKALNGTKFCSVTHVTEPVVLRVSGNHVETISFYAMDNSLDALVLGLPWLQLHNPHINWKNGSILTWSAHCHAACLSSAQPPVLSQTLSDDLDLSNVPPEYFDLRQVLSKARASSLPPHRPYDCGIDPEPLRLKDAFTRSHHQRGKLWISIYLSLWLRVLFVHLLRQLGRDFFSLKRRIRALGLALIIGS